MKISAISLFIKSLVFPKTILVGCAVIISTNTYAQSCDQIGPTSNPLENTVLNTSANGCNQTLFNNSGALINDGTLTNKTGARIENRDFMANGSITNNGILNNDGSLRISRPNPGGTGFLNNGVLNNNVGGNVGVAQAILANYGTWNNYGTLSAAGSLLQNFGTFDNAGIFSSDTRFQNFGIMYNRAGALISTGNDSVNFNTGQLINSGAITGIDMLSNSGTLWITSTGTFSTTLGLVQTDGLTRIDGSVSRPSGNQYVSVQGGVLQGIGSMDNLSVTGGTLAPGDSVGTLTVQHAFSFSNAVLQTEIAGIGSGQVDLLKVGGQASFLSGTLGFSFASDYVPNVGDHWTFLTADGGITGFSNLNYSFSGVQDYWEFDVSSNNNELTLTVAAIPEPEIYAMLAAGLGFMGFAVRRHKQKDVIKA